MTTAEQLSGDNALGRANQLTRVEPLLLSVDGAAAALGISRPTLYKLLAAGKVGGVKLGGRTLVRMDSLREYVDTLASYPVTIDVAAPSTTESKIMEPAAHAR